MLPDSIKEFIVSGPGRTGGHVLLGIMVAAGYPVIYTHNPLFQRENYSEYGLLICLRRDIFSAVMSNTITHKIGQSTEYPRTTLEPFDVVPSDFEHILDLHLKYQVSHDMTRDYGLVEHFYFEDFVNDHSHVLDRLHIKRFNASSKTTNSLGQAHECSRYFNNRAPYHYKDVVSNWEELKQIFDQTTAMNL
jgi:hypothetical protein